MQLIKHKFSLVLLLLASATCGLDTPAAEPESTWMLGIVRILHGVPDEDHPILSYGRGAMCTKRVSCPEGVGQCEGNEVIWCDEPPMQCLDDDLPCKCL